MGTAPIFSSDFSWTITGKFLIVNSTVENNSIHPSEKKIARFTLEKIVQ